MQRIFSALESKGVISLRQLRNELFRILSQRDFSHYASFKKQHTLLVKHRKIWLDWACANCGLDFATVVFSDEKLFGLANDSYLALPLKIFRKGQRLPRMFGRGPNIPYMTKDLIFQLDNCSIHVSKSIL